MKIAAILVTYNRLSLLKEVLSRFEMMEVRPSSIIIVNNNSNDGTKEYLELWKEQNTSISEIIILNLKDNIGGSGGFYYGISEALKTECDWFWVSDDDAFPDLDSFSKVRDYLQTHDNLKLGAVCGSVINNSKIDIQHRRRLKGYVVKKEVTVPENEYDQPFELDVFSYVGTVIKRECLETLGLPDKDYFIWYDDTEHSIRISKKYKIVCIPEVKIIHNIPEWEEKYSWKTFYGVRNQLLTYKRHFKLTYFYLILKYLLLMVKGDKVVSSIYLRAIWSSFLGQKGISNIYKPGKKI